MEAAQGGRDVPAPPMAPFQGLMSSQPGLHEKLRRDPIVETYSIYGFFPEVYRRIYVEGARPPMTMAGRGRGRVAMLEFEGGGLVVKPLQSYREGEVAAIGAETGVGPVQYPSLEGYLTEERIAGAFFTEMAPEDIGDDSMYRAGAALGGILARLHQRRVYYNDATLSDPQGRSHLIVEPGGGCKLIDFGVSVLLDRHPVLERQDVYNFVRTLPMYPVLKRMGLQGHEMDRFLEEYAGKLARTSPEEIMSQDLRFAEEGLKMAAGRMGGRIVEPLARGFREAYGAQPAGPP